jgi:predicted O-methyltransferase YrrM
MLRLLWMARFFLSTVKEGSGAFLRFQPGYHGSTIPSGKFLQQNRERLFNPPQEEDGIDDRRAEQVALLQRLLTHYPEFDPPEHEQAGRLYHYANSMFGFPDAFVLYAMLREFKPKRVVEVGSGYSSALMLDASREFLPETRFTFVDPYSETIRKVLADRPEGHYDLQRTPVQDVSLDLFRELGDGDILFLDTSHAVKIGSDVSALLFRVLPALRPGVIVHFHDVFHPWEYPEDFVMAGRTYNEVYFLRAFLQFNSAFEILLNTSQMEAEGVFPPGYFDRAGVKTTQSLWLRRVR